MKTTSKDIRNIIKKQWPKIEHVWLWDNTYWKPPLQTMERLLAISNVPGMKFIDQFNDCDNFALQFLAETRRKRYMAFEQGTLPQEQAFPVSVGYVFGNLFRGVPKVHAANVFITNEDKVYLLDATPMENRIWEVAKTDNILFVFM